MISGVGLSLWFTVHQLNVILITKMYTGYNPAVLLLDGAEKHRVIVHVAVALITDFKKIKRVRLQLYNFLVCNICWLPFFGFMVRSQNKQPGCD